MTADAPIQPLDPLCFPLHGTRLIEASAGTGKTWTIALLYLRLVLRHGGEAAFARALAPPEILVVTFTEAATQELRERIRARLDEAARVFAGEQPAADGDALQALVDGCPADQRPLHAHQLRTAAQWMDEAAVATIHGWCWRMLREHAFDSGSPLEQQLQTDLRPLQQQVLQDHWRRHYYPLPAAAARALHGCFASPEALWQAVEPLLRQDGAALRHQGEAVADGDPVDALHRLGEARQRAEALEHEARRLWREDRAALEQLWRSARADLNGNTFRGRDDDATFDGWLQALADWSQGGEAPAQVARFGQARARLRKGARLPEHPALQAIDAWQDALEASDDPALRARLLAHAARAIADALAQEKRRRAELGFDDLLRQLDRALHGPGGAALAARIRAQFPVALIDEFQDTDPVQYRIFRRLYGQAGRDLALVMIGDPKQAIYAFRGADIRTYLRARRDTAGRHYALLRNHRSTAAVVRAVNALFGHAEQGPRGAFRLRTASEDPVPFVPVQARGLAERLLLAGRPAPALTLWSLAPQDEGGDSVPIAAYRAQLAEAAASEVVRWLSRADSGFAAGDAEGAAGPLRRLRPADIAVLVRSRTEAEAIRGALDRRGLRSVYLSDRESVFATPEAADLLHWLRAAATPADEALLRAALATRTLDLPLAQLEALRQDELAWERQALQWRALRELWQRHGVLPMLHQLLHDYGLPARWLAEGGERRLTNVLHLAEWLQRRAAQLDGEHALLRAFAERLADPGGEEDVLRLESDAALIQVVTIHKSKGLEYPLVLLPFIAAWRAERRHGGHSLAFHDDALGARVVELDGRHAGAAQQAEEERLAEDMRLLYVALTRARHGLWLGVAPLAASAASRAAQLHHGAWGQLQGQGAPIATHAAYQETLARLCTAAPDVAVRPAPAADDTRWSGPPAPATAAARRPLRPGHAPWWVASYSALAPPRGAAPEQAPPRGPEPEDARQDQALEAALDPPADAAAAPAPAAQGWHAFPRGAEAGSFLHGVLEWCAQQGFAQVLAAPQALRDLLARRCAVRGWEAWIEPLGAWVPRWLQWPLALPDGPPATLAQLRHYQSELEFWLPVQALDARTLDALVARHVLPGRPRPALPAARLAGMLKGFVDLVFAHGGRYWVADYKSNWLGPDARAYGAAALEDALLQHRYDVQAALYLLALHRLLRARLPDYDIDRHLGGAACLFLRGADAAGTGVWAVRAPRALVEALDAQFAGPGGPEATA
ncbi:exodeoxyribonuclease V subunit beta [Pseudorhodoferax sp.]|uniref:exodeoxyribonuclease V subunit beta n=1 Tax=Pseudorhodoferax sp. TaxID=1993553 RepID=UPI0039E64F16